MIIEKIKNNKIALALTICFVLAVLVCGVLYGARAVWADASDSNQPAASESSEPASETAAEELPQEEAGEESPVLFAASAESSQSEPEAAPIGEDKGYVTVGLYSSCSSVPSAPLSSIELSSEAGFILAKKTGRGWVFDSDYSNYINLVVEAQDEGIVVCDAYGEVLISGLCEDDVLMSAAQDPDSRIISFAGECYRDGAMFKSEGDGKMTVINFVELEHYLWGVINHEMTWNNPTEALKAQAVAARSFAISHFGHHQKYGFDLCTTGNCQYYGGIKGEKPETVQVCRDTAGIVMSYEGGIAAGYYSANSGGYTMNSEDAWSGRIGYLRAVPDGYADFTVWNVTTSFAELAAKLEAEGNDVGEIRRVEVLSRYDNGAVRTVEVEGSLGTVSLSSSKARSCLGARTKLFSLGNSPYPGIMINETSITNTYWVMGEEIDFSSSVFVMGANGTVEIQGLGGIYVMNNGTIVPLEEKSEEIAMRYPSFYSEPAIDGAVYISGVGRGHGVGMSQVSAIAMAKDGWTFDRILSYFYTGIELVPCDDFVR